MSYKAVIFDLDGTLLDTLEDIGESMNEVLERKRLPVHQLDSYRYFVGEGMKMLVKRALPSGSRQEHIDQCLAEMKEVYQSRWNLKTRPYAGIEELLLELKHREIKLAVYTNKPHEFTISVVKYYFGDLFSNILGAGQFPHKPDPTGIMHLKEKLGFSEKQLLYVGDSATDMKTAKAGGLYAVGVLWGFRTADELRSSGADMLIEKPSDLLGIV